MSLSQMFDEHMDHCKKCVNGSKPMFGTRVPMNWATATTSLAHVVSTLSALWHKDNHQLKHSHSYKFCSLLYIWLWRYFSSVLMDQLGILFLSVFLPVSLPFSLSHSSCLHLWAIFFQLPRMSTCMYLTPTGCQWWCTVAKAVAGKKKKKKTFFYKPACVFLLLWY